MLAYNGLALITEKLQNQRLEEASPPSASSAGAKLQQVSPEGSTRTTSQSNLAVKGKNVWALSLESERHGRLEMATAEVKIPSRPQEKTQAAGASVCRHRKLRHMCQVCCDNWVGTPTAPPKKKHCRSLSVPPEGPVSLPTPGKEPGAKIWRPIAVIPLSNSATASALNHNNAINNNSILPATTTTTSCVGSSSSNNNSILLARQDSKDRDFVYPSNAMSAMVCPPFNESSVTTGKWLPRLTSSGGFVKLLPPKSSASSPSVPSSPSVDSGHFTTSDLQTPPGSPVPRPASAASSDTSSFSSLGSPWLEYSPLRGPRVRVLENRSLSLEDRISGSASSAASTPSFHSGFDPSHRCRSSSSQDGAGEGCGEAGGGPCGGLGGIIPRCHSQPCVLHHRRCGKKRRRDCDNRPNLNFNKMTETAYTRSHRRSEPWNTAVSEHQPRVPGQHEFIDIMRSSSSSRGTFFLNPIASSPLDSELPPVMSGHPSSSSAFLDVDLSQAASIALPLTPPEHSSPGLLLRDNDEASVREDDWDEEEEEEEEDTDHRNCGCHDSRADDGVGLFPMNDLDLDQIENH